MPKRDTIRAARYVRVSTDAQAREEESLADQRNGIERYCKAGGFRLVEVVEDRGITGKDFRTRPGMLRIKEVAERKGIDKIIARDMTRLGRSARELLNALAYLEDDCGVQVVLLKEALDTSTPAGRLLLARAGK
jgi:site-specific DNA recombinase